MQCVSLACGTLSSRGGSSGRIALSVIIATALARGFHGLFGTHTNMTIEVLGPGV